MHTAYNEQEIKVDFLKQNTLLYNLITPSDNLPWSFQVKNVKLFTDNSNRLPESLKLPKNIYVHYKVIFNFYTNSDHGCLCCLLFLYINEDYLLVFIIKELFAWFFVANGWFLWPCMTQAKENPLRRHIHINSKEKDKKLT